MQHNFSASLGFLICNRKLKIITNVDLFVETICVDFEFGADKFNNAIHKSYLKARYFFPLFFLFNPAV